MEHVPANGNWTWHADAMQPSIPEVRAASSIFPDSSIYNWCLTQLNNDHWHICIRLFYAETSLCTVISWSVPWSQGCASGFCFLFHDVGPSIYYEVSWCYPCRNYDNYSLLLGSSARRHAAPLAINITISVMFKHCISASVEALLK
jgi:hypothetical protein